MTTRDDAPRWPADARYAWKDWSYYKQGCYERRSVRVPTNQHVHVVAASCGCGARFISVKQENERWAVMNLREIAKDEPDLYKRASDLLDTAPLEGAEPEKAQS